MAERAEADPSQVPADSAKAEVASDAETLEMSPPMLDVHAPHMLTKWKSSRIRLDTRSRASIENFRRCQMVTLIFPMPRRRQRRETPDNEK